MKYNVQITRYERFHDKHPSHAWALKSNDERWAVYCTYGSSWAWNKSINSWVRSADMTQSNVDDFLMTKSEALMVLETIPSKQESISPLVLN
jgi:hypothetical protein